MNLTILLNHHTAYSTSAKNPHELYEMDYYKISRTSRNGRSVTPRSGRTNNALRMSTTRVSGYRDPRPTTSDIVLTKVVTLSGSSTATPINFTPDDLTGSGSVVPTSFRRIRLVKLSVYAESGNGNSIILSMLHPASDLATFQDFGTSGAIRPQIHIQPNFDLRDLWLDVTDSSNPVFQITVPSGVTYVVQPTLEMRT